MKKLALTLGFLVVLTSCSMQRPYTGPTRDAVSVTHMHLHYVGFTGMGVMPMWQANTLAVVTNESAQVQSADLFCTAGSMFIEAAGYPLVIPAKTTQYVLLWPDETCTVPAHHGL